MLFGCLRGVVQVCLALAIVFGVWVASAAVHLQTRSYELERQDMSPEEGRYTLEEYQDMMSVLAELNVVLPEGHQSTLAAIQTVADETKSPIKRVLEVGFGRGDLSIMAGRALPDATVVGIDAHRLSVDVATAHLDSEEVAKGGRPSNVRFEHRAAVELSEPEGSYDIVTTTWVNHHIFPDDALVDFFRRVRKTATKAFVFNDYQRSLKCYVSISVQLRILDVLQPILPTVRPTVAKEDPILKQVQGIMYNRPGLDLITDGGVLSMARALTIPEYEALLSEAGYPAGSLRCTNVWDAASPPRDTSPADGVCRMTCVVDTRA